MGSSSFINLNQRLLAGSMVLSNVDESLSDVDEPKMFTVAECSTKHKPGLAWHVTILFVTICDDFLVYIA